MTKEPNDFVTVNLKNIPPDLIVIGKRFGAFVALVEGKSNRHIKQKCQAIKKVIEELKKINELWTK